MTCSSCGRENPPEARFCLGCGAPSARAAADPEPRALPPPPAGERRQLTVLFCDLVGSTELSARLDPEDWQELLAAYQARAAEVVALHGGHVAQYLGDGILVYFGWPKTHEDAAERAVRAALALVKAAAGPADGTALSVRIGLHTGAVVVSALGGEGRTETLAVGEVPNVAARVQSAAEPNTVVITAATQRLVAGMFVVEARGPTVLKGVSKPLALYRVDRPSGVRSRLDLAAGRLTRFVGRKVELATLEERWRRSRNGEGQSVLVVGEAGVGKSRLVYQFREELATVPHTWLECSATPYTASTPFHSAIALVSKGLAFAAEDTATDKIAKLEDGLGDLASAETVALLADFVGLPPPSPLPMSRDLQRRRTIDLLTRWTLALSEVQPLVLLVEDLHWCDASSLELLGSLIARSATVRLLVLATARPEFVPPWPSRSNLATLELARLTALQAREMVAALGGEALPAGTLDALVARADGVPLYLEELTKTVVEDGAARGAEAIPATLADSLMARLDRLSAAKEVAQRAAVLGREFSYSLLAAVPGLEEAALREGLARLVEAEIVFARGEPPQAAYVFKHALVQEAAYASLLKRTRQQLHGRVVDVLLAEFAERAAAEPEVVARHAEGAGRIDDAIAFYQRAGESAQARFAHEEAIRHLRHAIALLETRAEGAERDARELAVRLLLGGSLIVARGFAHPEVQAAYERARILSDALDDAGRLGLALAGLAVFFHNCGEVERARALASRLLATAERSGDRELMLLAHLEVALAESYQGKFASSLAHCETARTLYEPGRHHATSAVLPGDTAVCALDYAASNLWHLGWPERALARAEEGVVLARRLDDPFSLAFALFFETVVHWLRRDVGAQLERAAETIEVSEPYDFPLWLGLGRTFHAAARVAGGESGAIADVLAGLALAAETGTQGGSPALFALLGEAYLTAARFDEASGAVETGLAVSAQTGQPNFDAELHRLRGELGLATGGASADAEALFHRALEIARSQEAKSFELRAATSLARLWQQLGKRDAARALLAPAYEWFTEGFSTPDLKAAKALLAELSLGRRDGDQGTGIED